MGESRSQPRAHLVAILPTATVEVGLAAAILVVVSEIALSRAATASIASAAGETVEKRLNGGCVAANEPARLSVATKKPFVAGYLAWGAGLHAAAPCSTKRTIRSG